MAANPFTAPGQWLKGNLHCHSNQSDGQPSPQQIVDIYAEAGYDFLAITDHNRLTSVEELDHKGLTLIPGSEINGGRAELGQHYHMVLIGQREPAPVTGDMPIQEIIDGALSVGEVCWIAHPSWSSITARDLLDLRGTLGIEVYNTTCHHGIGRGESAVQWDELWARGQRPLALAVDDAHWHYEDALGGWIVARAAGREPQDILAAVREGLFYASNGPAIESVAFEGRTVTVTCSPAQEVRLINPMPGAGWTTFRQQRPGLYTEIEWTIPDAWNMVRVEVVDDRGRKAWTNPFTFD
jgi:hypothetical protein